MKCFLLISLIFLLSCNTSEKNEISKSYAEKLSKKFIIVDGHVDVPYRINKKYEDISQSTAGGHTDYPRLVAGGLDAPFMSIYIPAEYYENGYGKDLADSLIDIVESLEQKWPDKFKIAQSVADVKNNFAVGIISLPMGMENGTGIDDDLENLKHFYNRGIRYITLTHSKNNLIGGSSYDKERTWDGLTEFGENVVKEMNRLGIMVDISHVSDSTFYDVLKVTQTPPIASHSSCRFYTPDLERNMSDQMIKALAKKGGVIMINFGSYFVNGEFQQLWDEAEDYGKEHNLSEEERDKMRAEMKKDGKFPNVSIEAVVKHIHHVVDLVGIDYVGFGSDFDGVDNLPDGLTDVSMYPDLIYLLLKSGYTEHDIEKICSGNIFRVWSEVEQYAALSRGLALQ